jgi:Fe2+ transport system protein FeoA
LRPAKKDRRAQLGIVLVFDSRRRDSPARRVESLSARIKSRSSCRVIEASYSERDDGSDISQAVGRVVEQGAERVVVIPAPISPQVYDNAPAIRRAVKEAQAAHPGVEVVYGGPLLNEEDYENLIVNAIHEHEMMAQEPRLVRLNELPPGEVGTVHSLKGGRHFISRMVSLGFTPGTEVRIVQNYGHGGVRFPDMAYWGASPRLPWLGCLFRALPIGRGKPWKGWFHAGKPGHPGHGSIIANVRNTRVALGWREAQRVLVIPRGGEEGNG